MEHPWVAMLPLFVSYDRDQWHVLLCRICGQCHAFLFSVLLSGVVNHCVFPVEPPWLVLQYLPNGDLKNYLIVGLSL